jgi:uncharacterized membrane protein YdbT with pleckstrin-like domain
MIRTMVKNSLLATGETVVFSAHAHWKNLAIPVLVTALAAAGVTYCLLEVVPSPEDQAWQRWAIIGAGALVVLIFGLWPFLGWVSSTDTLTTRRLISRRGIFSREGKDIPIDRVHSVSYRRTLSDRLFGCGTLVVQTAGDNSDVELFDVAHIERRMLQIQEIMLDEEIPAEGSLAASADGRDGT